MTAAEIREAIRSTMRPAEMIWGVASPAQPGSTWIGYAATPEEVAHLDGIVGNDQASFAPDNPKHGDVLQLIADLLPSQGRDLFFSCYHAETIYVSPAKPMWTPSVHTISMATDPNDGNRKFTLFTAGCTAAK